MIQNAIKTLSKSADELRVANYIVLFGGRDLTGEFFTEKTALESSYTSTGVLHVDFEHGLDPDRVGMTADDVIGVVDWKTAKVDEHGVFVERSLKRQARYMKRLEELIEAGVIGTSSQAVSGKAKKSTDGEIHAWPLMRDTLTFTPAEPRMLKENVLMAAKSLLTVFPDSKSLSDGLRGFENFNPNLKAAIETAASIREIEAALRDSGGFDRANACALVSRIKALAQGELAAEEQAKRELAEVFAKFCA